MKLVKSLLLGTAAGLAAVASAQAADLPFRKAAPVDYVRVCDWVGKAGYFYIPGTDTCLNVGGEARYEFSYFEQKASFSPKIGALNGAVPVGALNNYLAGTYTPGRLRNTTGYLGRGEIQVDARTQTAYGLVRAFAALQGNFTSGNENVQFGTANANGTSLDKGYITFAGITAGRVQSFFDFYADNYNYFGIANSDQSTEALAYTATFGGGFSATISVETPFERRAGINTVYYGNTSVNLVAPRAAGGIYGSSVGYAGVSIPDVVGVLRYDNDAWGSVQLSAAYHDVTTSTSGSLIGVAGYQGATEAGWAVQGATQIKLPMLAAGDSLWLEGAYQEGAYLYQDAFGNMNSGGALGGFADAGGDAIAIGNTVGGAPVAGYHLDLGKGFSVMGAFHHYFTPQFHDVLYGSYEELSFGNAARNIDWTRGGIGDSSQYKIGNQFIFTPVSKLDIGVDVMYTKLNQDLAHEAGGAAPTPLPAGIKLNPDQFTVRLRINRDF